MEIERVQESKYTYAVGPGTLQCITHTHTKRDGVRHDGSKASYAAHNWLAAAAMAWQAEWLSSKWGYL